MRTKIFLLFFIHCLLLNVLAMDGGKVVVLWSSFSSASTLLVSFTCAYIPASLYSFYEYRLRVSQYNDAKGQDSVFGASGISSTDIVPAINKWRIGSFYLLLVVLWLLVITDG